MPLIHFSPYPLPKELTSMTSISSYMQWSVAPSLYFKYTSQTFSPDCKQTQTTQCFSPSQSGYLKYISNQSCPNNHAANHFHQTWSSSNVSIYNLMKWLFIQYTSQKLSNTFNIYLSFNPHTHFFTKTVNYYFLKYLLHFCTSICAVKTLLENYQHLSPGLL